jgi:AcrR family transcriptional regulator
MTAAQVRADRRKARRRDEILKVACGQVAGTGALSLRGIGRSLDLTAPGLYRYYRSIAELEAAVAREVLATAVASVADASWDGYTRWAAQNPNLFAFLAKHPGLIAELHVLAADSAIWALHPAVNA